MKIYTDNLSINHDELYISGIGNIPEFKDIFLDDCAMAFTFHEVNDLIPENTSYETYSFEFISIFQHNISLSLEELMPVMVSR